VGVEASGGFGNTLQPWGLAVVAATERSPIHGKKPVDEKELPFWNHGTLRLATT